MASRADETVKVVVRVRPMSGTEISQGHAVYAIVMAKFECLIADEAVLCWEQGDGGVSGPRIDFIAEPEGERERDAEGVFIRRGVRTERGAEVHL